MIDPESRWAVYLMIAMLITGCCTITVLLLLPWIML